MRNTLRALFAFLGFPNLLSKNYTCSTCGYTWPKANEKPSGWKDHPYGYYIHCPKCGTVVSQYVKK